MNLYVYTFESWERETESERDKVTQGEKRDICGFPLQGPRRPAWFFIRYSGLWCCSCCLLSHTDCYALRYVRGQTLADYMDCDCESIFKEKSSKKKPLMLPLLHFQRSHTEGHYDERAGRGSARLAPRTFLSAVVWVSLTERPICCHFCLYTHTHTHSVLCNKWCLATKCSKSSSHPDCARFRSSYGCRCSQLWQIAKKILEITDAVLIRGDQGMLLPITNQETKEVSALHSYLVVRDAIIWLRSSQRNQFKTTYKLICKLHT